MSSLDADKDGHISFEEFKAGFKVHHLNCVDDACIVCHILGLQCWWAGQ